MFHLQSSRFTLAVLLTTMGMMLAGATPALAAAPFGFEPGPSGFEVAATNEDGSTDVLAGSHPFAYTTTFSLKTMEDPTAEPGFLIPVQQVRDVKVELPPGLIGNPTAVPRCSESEFLHPTFASNPSCGNDTVVGYVVLKEATVPANKSVAGELQFAVYNLQPPGGVPAEFGFALQHLLVTMTASVRTGSDYGDNVALREISQSFPTVTAKLTLWGVPAEASHDSLRGSCLGEPGSCPAGVPPKPFLTLPTACSGPLLATIEADGWDTPGKFAFDSSLTQNAEGVPVGIEGCERLDFSPSVSVRPDTTVADSPSGLSVDLHVPQIENPAGLAEADLRNSTVMLPAGMTINPSAANGLGACTPEQVRLSDASSPSCPDSSKIGEVEIVTPLLEEPLKGGVFLAQQGNNPFGSLLAMYLVAEDSGVVVKLAGHVEANTTTGQLTTTFQNNPQVPFSDLKLKLFGGARAALASPAACGSYEAAVSLTPWSGTPAVSPTAGSFGITSGCGGGFAPSFAAGTQGARAGAYSPFVLTFSRNDGEQQLSDVQQTLPPGLSAKLAGVPLCGEPQAAQGACPEASRIGTVTTTAGVGSDPVTNQGAIYLTGPYEGAPFGEVVEVPAIDGPFNLDEGGKPVTIRGAIRINPNTAQATVLSDPFPTILRGIPLHIRSVHVVLDRPRFTFNPTNCSPMSVTGTVTSTQGANSAVSSPFQASNCASLPFKPSLTASTQGKASKANGESLTVKVLPPAGQANIHKVELQIPKQLPSRLTTLQKACAEAVFNANPAACPPQATIGTATAHTPILNVPLTGPAILVSHGGAAFPDVEFLLQGEGVEIVLDGKTQIKNGITYSRFETVPDAPVTSFETVLPEGPHSILGANLPKGSYNFCGQKLGIPTTITGQNGAVVKRTTAVAVSGCPKAKAASKKKAKASRHKARRANTNRRAK